MDLLRFITAGSVDDGKSTLIGRLLYDSKSLLQDQIDAIRGKSDDDGELNLALLTDGLRSEREQGITIDVAYKYFSTPLRKFIIADSPGHAQYTRNMVTGASKANAAVILIDLQKGIREQTYRHSYIASLMRIPHLVVCINKMDTVNYSEEAFLKIKKEYLSFSARLEIRDIVFIPVSALTGENVVELSPNMKWYEGKSLLRHLETVYIESDMNMEDSRFPVQYVIKEEKNGRENRYYAGQVASGIFKKGDSITVLPSGFSTKVHKIISGSQEIDEVFHPMSVTFQTEDELDISRGNTIVRSESVPAMRQEFHAEVCWMDSMPLSLNRRYLFRQGTSVCLCVVKKINYILDINTFENRDAETNVKFNDIACVTIRTSAPIIFDEFRNNRQMGCFILIDEGTNLTAGAGIIIAGEET